MDVSWLGLLNGPDSSFSFPAGHPQKSMKGPFFPMWTTRKMTVIPHFSKMLHRKYLDIEKYIKNEFW